MASPLLKELKDSGLLIPADVSTSPIEGQKPGTSGLRKKTKIFMQGHYLHNFVQSVFDSLPQNEVQGSTLVVGGDGRYYTREAIQVIIKIAAANGVGRIWVGKGGLFSTPAVSAVIREREGGAAYGGIILTASHNPGGIDEDFGIKYNVSNGGPAPESLTDAMYARTRTIDRLRVCQNLPDFDLDAVGRNVVESDGKSFVVEIVDSTEDYFELLSRVFDFAALKSFVHRKDFSMHYDALSGVAGAYATKVFEDILGLPSSWLHNCVPLPDFGGHHPDPNLTYAPELVEALGLTRDGSVNPAKRDSHVPEFGAAQDGDADRNMILGKRFFVTPSDSVAVIAANASAIPFFAQQGGLRGVARSMPTSAALDRVASKNNLRLFEVPTGWKFFGNLMDSALLGKDNLNPFLCGEESFGTGSDHVREKDGLWAVLAWLSILAKRNEGVPEGQLVTVEAIVCQHWREYGRNFYCRYDYEGVDTADADKVMAELRGRIASFTGQADLGHGYALARADEFKYVDPVDGSISDKQGLRFIMSDGSRIIYRLSGTGSVGATIRVYLERYEPDPANHDVPTAEALKGLVAIALDISKIEAHTGRKEPTVIT